MLVDRLWPRGLSHERARLDDWLRDLAPSTGLRRWFGHVPARWEQFQDRYRAELLDNPALDQLYEIAAKGPVTLVFAASDEDHNNAVVLKSVLEEHRQGP